MRPYLELMRPSVFILAVFGVLCGAILNNIYDTYLILLGAIPAVLISGAGNVINDYFDVDIDRINKPRRPIPSGRVKRNDALYFFLGLVLVGNLLAWFVNPYYFLIGITSTVLSYIYAFKLKRTPLLGNISVAYLSSITILAGGILVPKSMSTEVLAVFFTAFFGSISREITKDVEDMLADKKGNALTLPILFGERTSYMIALFFALVAFLMYSLIAFEKLVYTVVFFVGLVLSMYAFTQSPERSQRILKVVMFFVILGTLFGKVGVLG